MVRLPFHALVGGLIVAQGVEQTVGLLLRLHQARRGMHLAAQKGMTGHISAYLIPDLD